MGTRLQGLNPNTSSCLLSDNESDVGQYRPPYLATSFCHQPTVATCLDITVSLASQARLLIGSKDRRKDSETIVTSRSVKPKRALPNCVIRLRHACWLTFMVCPSISCDDTAMTTFPAEFFLACDMRACVILLLARYVEVAEPNYSKVLHFRFQNN